MALAFKREGADVAGAAPIRFPVGSVYSGKGYWNHCPSVWGRVTAPIVHSWGAMAPIAFARHFPQSLRISDFVRIYVSSIFVNIKTKLNILLVMFEFPNLSKST